MISETIAKKQALRLGQMMGFPADKQEAFRELALAVQSANTEQLAIIAISSFLDTADSQTRCPMPSEVRSAINSRQGSEQKFRCEICGGTGFSHVYQLVTYKGKSFTRKSQHDIPDVRTEEEAHAFQRRIILTETNISDTQMVLSAARPCVCLPATHKLLTGERA